MVGSHFEMQVPPVLNGMYRPAEPLKWQSFSLAGIPSPRFLVVVFCFFLAVALRRFYYLSFSYPKVLHVEIGNIYTGSGSLGL